jgi:small subunit ribosomal protein S21
MLNHIIPGFCWYGYRNFVVTGTLGAHLSSRVILWGFAGEHLLVKIVLRERESVQEAVRRFRKIVERSGLKREVRSREYYEKPSDVKRKARNRAIRKAKANVQAK